MAPGRHVLKAIGSCFSYQATSVPSYLPGAPVSRGRQLLNPRVS